MLARLAWWNRGLFRHNLLVSVHHLVVSSHGALFPNFSTDVSFRVSCVVRTGSFWGLFLLGWANLKMKWAEPHCQPKM